MPLPGSVPDATHGVAAQVVVGYAKTQQAIAGAVEYIGTLKEPEQFTFVCPEGIDIITKQESYRNAMRNTAAKPIRTRKTLTGWKKFVSRTYAVPPSGSIITFSTIRTIC